MKKKGFTLIELLAVISILAIIILISVPNLLKAIKGNKEKTLDKTKDLIVAAAKNYVVDYDIDTPNVIGLDDLCGTYINCPIKNPVTEEDIDGCVKITISSEIENYTFIDNPSECTGGTNSTKLTLKVNLNGGVTTQTFNEGYDRYSSLTLVRPTKEDWVFIGWRVTKGNAEVNTNTLQFKATDVEIDALWGKNVELTLDLDGGSSSQVLNNPYVTNTNIELVSPAKTGYSFTGWELVSGDSIISGNNITLGLENTTIKATYSLGNYTITYNLDEGTNPSGVKTSYTVEDAEYTLPIPTKPCYEFMGWYENSDFSGSPITKLESGSIGNKVYYAKWLEKDIVYVSSSGNDSNIGINTSTPFATINKAYTCPGNITIKLLSDITQASEADFNTLNKEVTLTSNTGTYTITRGNGLTSGSIIELSNKGTLTTTNITFDGNNVNATKSVLYVSGASTLNLNAGTTVKNGINSNAGGGIYADSSSITINGALISNNKTSNGGGGVFSYNSTVLLNNGTIKENNATWSGGGMFIDSDIDITSFTMKGGIIEYNESSGIDDYDGAGAIHIRGANGTTSVNIQNGTISNNSSLNGALIFDNRTGTFTANLSGGIIQKNTATNHAGGILCYNSSGDLTFNMTGGTISENVADYYGGGLVLNKSNGTVTANISDNAKIINNTAKTYGGGISCFKGSLNISGGTISNNSCTYSYTTQCGGGIFMQPSTLYSKTGGTLSGNSPQDFIQGQ